MTIKRGVKHEIVRKSFSHGRSKAVVVEKVKRRSVDGIPGIQERKTGKKNKSARKRKKNIQASSPESKPTGQVFSVSELLLGEDDGSSRKRRKKGPTSGGGSSLQYREPSAVSRKRKC